MNSLDQSGLIDLLLSIKSDSIKYIPNPGNAGDSVIAYSTFQLFRQLNLNVSVYHRETHFAEEDVLVYGGGGNLVPQYHDLEQFLISNRHVRKLIVLPHTVWGHQELISSLSSNVFIFAREKVSYDHLISNSRFPENHCMAHDMAFMMKGLNAVNATSQLGALNAFRIDVEKTDIQLPENNIDLSVALATPHCTSLPKQILQATRKMIYVIAHSSSVSTNRIHVAILASLLNKKTRLYPNSYFKNKAIYNFSIKGRFPLTSFVDS